MQKLLGTIRFIKSDQESWELLSGSYAAKNDIVWSAEFDFIEEGIYNAQRYYDRQGRPVSARGTKLPKRPASVPERAYYVDQNNSFHVDAHWQMSEIDIRTNKYTGYIVMWDRDGDLLSKYKYDTSNRIREEEYEYEYGNVRYAKWSENGVQYESFYHRFKDKSIIHRKIVHRNEGNDSEQTIFDKTGQQLYVVRDEIVTSLHRRRYYNNILVYENEDPRINYFYPNGTILVDYSPNSDGTGHWQLYDEQGQVVLKMPENYKHKPWEVFMPGWKDYGKEGTPITAWDAITANFRKKYNEVIIENKIAALEAPAHLQAEFDKIDMDNSLLTAFTGLLSKEEEVANVCFRRIWSQMEYEETLLEVKVGIILARMLPYYLEESVIRQQLYKFLCSVVELPNIKGLHELYAELQASLEPLLPLFFEWAAGPDDEIARQAQYVLLIAGNEQPATATLLLQEWNNTTHARVRRSYAVFALGAMYAFNGETEKMIFRFSPAFNTETDALVRLILAVYLVAATKEEADERWLATLLTTLINASALRDDFDNMKPFRGESFLEEYLLALLHDMTPDVLEKHIASIIAQLPAISGSEHAPLFEAICTMILSGDALPYMEPLTKKVLLAIADIVEKDSGFVDKEEDWFKDYSIPTHADHIKDLAASKDK